jgi:hypothetical protein
MWLLVAESQQQFTAFVSYPDNLPPLPPPPGFSAPLCVQVSYSQAQKCYVAACPEGVKPEIPGQMPKSNIVTAQSAQRGTAQQPQPAPPPAAAAQGDGPTIIEIEEPGRRLLGSAAVQQDVFVVMSFAASCFSLCE